MAASRAKSTIIWYYQSLTNIETFGSSDHDAIVAATFITK